MSIINYDFTNNQTFDLKEEKPLLQEGDIYDANLKISMWGENSSSAVINVDHIANNTKSKVVIRAILSDSAKLKITGELHILPTGRNSDAYFEAKVLILGNKARCIALPELKIDNKDVQAKHAVVIKKISEDDLYFLASRGINKQKAVEIIKEGFLNI